MQSIGGAAKLLEHDDIVTSLVVDPVMGFQRRKLSSESFPAPPIHEKTNLVNIVESIRKGEDVARALDELLSCEFTKTFTAHMDEAGLREHLRKYLIGFTDEGGFKIASETRYSMEGFQGAKVLSTKRSDRGDKIKNLVGSSRVITDDFEKQLGVQKVDTSCIIESSRTKSAMVVIGPISFVNHDCSPNCRFEVLPNNLVGLQAIKAIQAGDELTISYGENYFGRENKSCECATCQDGKKGAFKKRGRGERRDRDLFIPKEEDKIVKVNSMFYVSINFPNNQPFFVVVPLEERRLLSSNGGPDLEGNRLKVGKRPESHRREVLAIPKRQIFRTHHGNPERERQREAGCSG